MRCSTCTLMLVHTRARPGLVSAAHALIPWLFCCHLPRPHSHWQPENADMGQGTRKRTLACQPWVGLHPPLRAAVLQKGSSPEAHMPRATLSREQQGLRAGTCLLLSP